MKIDKLILMTGNDRSQHVPLTGYVPGRRLTGTGVIQTWGI